MTATYVRCLRCGRTVRNRHAARATIMRGHTCRPDRRRQPRDDHVIDRGAADGTCRDCPHVKHRHDHGTRAAYLQDGCRCHPCRLANRTAQQARRRAIAYDRWHPFVEAEPIRAHIAQLVRTGISLNRIAELSSVSRSALHALVYGKPSAGRPPNIHVRAPAAHRILAIRASAVARADHARLPDNTGSVRRLQALMALGWSMTRLAGQLHRHPSSVSRLLADSAFTATTDRAIRILYEQLATQPVPITSAGDRASIESARRYANARGWATPDRWNDIDRDRQPQPTAADDTDIDRVAVDRALHGPPVVMTLAERRVAARELTQQGLSLHEIAARLHTHPRTISRYRRAQPDGAGHCAARLPTRPHGRLGAPMSPASPTGVRPLDRPGCSPGLARDAADDGHERRDDEPPRSAITAPGRETSRPTPPHGQTSQAHDG